MSNPKSSSNPSLMVEDAMPEECRNKLCTLPKQNWWWTESYLYQYQGFWLLDLLFKKVSAGQKVFQARDTDIIVVSGMKCGTTWLKSLAFAIRNRMLYLPTDAQHPLVTKNSHDLVRNLEFDLDLEKEVPDDDAYSSTSHRLLSTHLPYVLLPDSVKSSTCKLIYICRNPKDVFVSKWLHFRKLTPPEKGIISIEEAFEMFCRGVSMFGPFWDHVLEYWKKSLECPDKVLFLKYEELREEPNLHIKCIAEFMGCPFSEEEEASGIVDDIVNLCSFKHLSNLEVNRSGKNSIHGVENNVFFRHATVEDWKNYLTPEMGDRLDRLTAEKFQEFGLKL